MFVSAAIGRGPSTRLIDQWMSGRATFEVIVCPRLIGEITHPPPTHHGTQQVRVAGSNPVFRSGQKRRQAPFRGVPVVCSRTYGDDVVSFVPFVPL